MKSFLFEREDLRGAGKKEQVEESKKRADRGQPESYSRIRSSSSPSRKLLLDFARNLRAFTSL